MQKVSLARRFALVPLGPPLLAYRSNCKAMLTAADGFVQLVVDRAYKAGEPIVVWYDIFGMLGFELVTRPSCSFIIFFIFYVGVVHSLTLNCFLIMVLLRMTICMIVL